MVQGVSVSTAHFDDQNCCQHMRPTSRSIYLPELWGKTHLWYIQRHVKAGRELWLGKHSFLQCCELSGRGYVKGDASKNLPGNVITREDELLLVIQDHIKITSHPFLSLTTCFLCYEYRSKTTLQWLLWPWWRNENSFCLCESGGLLTLLFSMRAWSLLMLVFRPLQVPVPSQAFDTARQDRLHEVIPTFFILSVCTVFLCLGNSSSLTACLSSSLPAYICCQLL